MSEQRLNLEDAMTSHHHQALRELLLGYRVTMISCAYWRNRAPWGGPTRTCDNSFLLFPFQGTLRIRTGRGVHLISPGHFLMLPEAAKHSMYLAEGHLHLRQFAVHCQIHDRWGRPLLARFNTCVGRLPIRSQAERDLRELTCLMNTDPEAGQSYGETWARNLLATQLRQGASLAPLASNGDPRVSHVLRRMELEFSSDVSIEEFARDIGLTTVQFRKLFRRETGEGPKRFFNRLRLREATNLLRHSSASVKQIAAECGFASDHYFHLVFRQRYGTTPSEYRDRLLGQI